MITDQELQALLNDLESDRVERKASLSDRNKIRQTICAFANDLPDSRLPGFIFIGVNDDGSCSNLAITDELLRTIADMRSDGNILPFPSMTVQKRVLAGCEIAVIEVQPADYPPVRYNGRVWIRVGPRLAQATLEEERRLMEKRRANILWFDQQPVTGATTDDLDLEYFRVHYLPAAVSPEMLAENQRPIEEQLASLRFLDRNLVPNVAAMIVFGKDPLRWLPGAYLQFLRLDGTELTDAIRHQVELRSPLGDLIRRLDEVLAANISTTSDVRSGSIEARQPDYPMVALQQLTRNALLHRTYESTSAPVRVYWFTDRIEIHNPGGLYGNVNERNFGQPGVTDYRNPLLAEAMKVLGFVQRFGLGIPLAKKELQKNGNPEPEFHFDPTRVLVTIRKRP